MTSSEFEQKAQELIRQSGLRPLSLMFDISENIYWGLCLVPQDWDPASWHPYKAHRDLKEIGAYCLYYHFDCDSTIQNNAGTLIYCPDDPEDLEEGEEPQVVNCTPWRGEDLEVELSEVPETHWIAILQRLGGLTETDHWNDAIRTDEDFPVYIKLIETKQADKPGRFTQRWRIRNYEHTTEGEWNNLEFQDEELPDLFQLEGKVVNVREVITLALHGDGPAEDGKGKWWEATDLFAKLKEGNYL
jgi:hypothetical protein